MLQLYQPFLNRLGPANDRAGEKVCNGHPFLGVQRAHVVGNRRGQPPTSSCDDAQHALVGAAGQVVGLGISGGGNQRHADDGIGLVQHG